MLWSWIGMLYVPLLLENEKIEHILLPQQGTEVITPIATPEASPVLVLIATGITVAILIVTIIVLLRAPATIARAGKTVTSKAAGSALPLLTRGKPISPAKKRRLTAGLIKLTKLLLVLLPVAIGFLGLIFETPLPFDVSMFVSSILALCAVIWFSAEYVTARLLAVDPTALV